MSQQRNENLKLSDHRVKLTNEILQGIRAIKSYNWENPFIAKLADIRNKELKALRAAANTRAILVCILSAAPSVVAVLTLTVYALLGNELSPIKVFTSLSLFNQLRFPITFLPMLLNTLADGKISLRRISKFLQAEEIENYVINYKALGSDSELSKNESNFNLPAINIRNGEFSWSSSSNRTAANTLDPTNFNSTDSNSNSNSNSNDSNSIAAAKYYQNRGKLKDVNVSIKEGELVAIVGQ